MKWALLALCAAMVLTPARADDGYQLWLRYAPLDKAASARAGDIGSEVVTASRSPTAKITAEELTRGLSGLLAKKVASGDAIRSNGAVLFGTPKDSPSIAGLALPLERVGSDGFVIKSAVVKGKRVTVIAGNTDVGALHGAFAFLRLVQTGAALDALDVVEAPKVKLRMIDHWDNLDRTMERGFSGFSIFNWWELPGHVDPQLVDYARAEASLGINGIVLTNPSGLTTAVSLTEPWLKKAAALADLFRPYGIKIYLSARFSCPQELGGLKTGDPLDPQVRAWWKAKADEIYRIIPDFGGFLVKANSEGQPGPQDFGRSHADGANMMAEALAPHGGIVIWRAFVYSPKPEDRVKQAYNEFKPFDGQFADNVVIQVKNGPLDFQPREPFSPLFGGLEKTPAGIELQITKEYLGFEIHLVYLGTLWQEVLQSDTYAKGSGSTVAHAIDGSLFHNKLSLIAGASNVGTARNWSGSIFDQANWNAYGRLAWNPDADARAIAEDWVRMTFTSDPAFVKPVIDMMMQSRETAVDTMTPLGLAHQMATGHHYGPGPWIDNVGRPDWNPTYYNGADKSGIGFDRTPTGSNAVAQYHAPLAAIFADPNKTPEPLLLWFHHLPWDHKMVSGRTLWDELALHYARGVENVKAMQATWARMKPYVDAERWQITADFLAMQYDSAVEWRDASIAYFQSLSGRPLPHGVPAPAHDLDWYKAKRLPFAPGNPGKTASPFRED
ncbi:alpha-glucuronidase family glycosyl hydrolase [Rhizomicrobium electricum]|uniref:Xylan alpha-1,2-glucuronidase n=1 Tax=Rhizomicrobium electricum TaxID=480070 RepID=A0ABN1ETS4_9PROT|nr:alpha-glucuronidase family glycosyl hydrolase [Rhizomicrobium electricum]NIJ49681.1 alpha-glucuronidase [Rhizomicrobium electricum]